MSSIPECRCGRVSINREILRGSNRGRWFWKCAKNLCGFFELNDPGQSTYTFTSYTIPRGPSKRTFTRKPTSNEQHIDRTLLNSDDGCDTSSVISLGSVNDKSHISRSRSKRQSGLTIVQMALYTNTDICVDAQARHGYLQTIFNTIPEIAWMANRRLWVFSADQQTYQRVWRLLQQHRGIFQVVGVPLAVLKYLPKTTKLLWEQLQQDRQSQHPSIENDDTMDDLLDDWDFDIENDDDDDDNGNDDGIGDDDDKERATDYDATDKTTATNSKIEWKLEDRIGESKLWQQMTAEQQSGLKKMIDMDGHVYLQDSASSGNSLQALGVTLVHRNDWPVLIICRASVCQKWNTLIQDTLLLDQHQISILDRDPSLDSPKAIQYLQMRRKRERLEKQKERARMMGSSTISPFSSKASSSHGGNKGRTGLNGKQTATTNLSTDREKGDLWIRILDNSGDTPPWRSPPTTNADNGSNQLAINHVTCSTKKNPSKKKRKLQKSGDIFIRIVDNSGDYTSNTEAACIDDDDDDFMDGNESDAGNTHGRNDMTTSCATRKRTLRKDNNEINNQVIPGTTHFFIISYDKAKTKLGALSATECKMIIFDDCHDLNGTLLPAYKTPLQNLVNASKKTIMVSDIPILPKPMESFPLLQILKPNTFVDYRFFGQRYCGAKQIVFGWDYTGLSNPFELEFFLSKTVLVA